MKVVITAMGENGSDKLDPRFGRAKFFILADTETGAMSAHDNAQNLNAAQGAGVQAAESVVRLGAEAVISGNVGPKAFRVLKAANVKMYLSAEDTVAEALEKFRAGGLKQIDEANVEAHW